MNKETQLSLFREALAANMSPSRFAQSLCGAPHKLTPPDATPIMREYEKFLHSTALRKTIPKISSAPRPKRAVSPTAGRKADGNDQPTRIPFPAPRGELAEAPAPETPAPVSLSKLNESATKKYALKVSKEKRAGKFDRVGKSFVQGVQADVDSLILSIGRGGDAVVPDPDAGWFITGKAARAIEEQLNIATRNIIQSRVMRHPSTGVTLK